MVGLVLKCCMPKPQLGIIVNYAALIKTSKLQYDLFIFKNDLFFFINIVMWFLSSSRSIIFMVSSSGLCSSRR